MSNDLKDENIRIGMRFMNTVGRIYRIIGININFNQYIYKYSTLVDDKKEITDVSLEYLNDMNVIDEWSRI